MKLFVRVVILSIICIAAPAIANTESIEASSPFDDLKNYQVNSENMLSSGLPSDAHFVEFKEIGVEHIVDLIPGDRSEERAYTQSLDLNYYNIQVIWDNPTLENFQDYVAIMQHNNKEGGKTLTHCKLNWRGAVFTYLYRVTQLNVPEPQAKKDLMSTWQPNDVWQAFIKKVITHYQVTL